MPNTIPPKVNMADEELPPILFAGKPNEEPPVRGWLCPDVHTIAAYIDGTLDAKQAGFESHLAKCEHCRRVVADVVKSQRETDLARPPLGVVKQAVQLVPARRPRARWIWIPAGAVAVMAVAIAAVVLTRQQHMAIPAPSAPNAVITAKSTSPSTPEVPVRDVIRKPAAADSLPSIISPQADSVVTPKLLRFSWKPVPGARSYEVQLVSSVGEPVWEGKTEKSVLQLPADVVLKGGQYFVWVTADRADGRLVRSPAVSFSVKR